MTASRPPDPRRGVAVAAAVAVAALAAYSRTLAPGILGGDAGEMQFVPVILSLAHPTGYPLMTLVGKAWTALLPLGSAAVEMNVLSAVCAAAGVGVVCLTVQALTGSPVAAAGSALLLAASDVFWGQAVIADKYALNALLVAAMALAATLWLQAPSPRRLCFLSVVAGLALAHHRSAALFLPVLLGAVVLRRGSGAVTRATLGRAGLLFVAPLVLYLWLPVGAARGLPPGTWRPVGLGGWIGFLADRGYIEQVRPFTDLGAKLLTYGRSLVGQFGVLGAALGLLGALRQAWRREAALAVLGPGYALQVLLAAGYEVPRHWVFFLPSFVLYAVWVGEGLAAVADGASLAVRRLGASPGRVPAVAAAALALVALAAVLPQNYARLRGARVDGGTLDLWRQDLKAGYLAERFARLALGAAEPGAIIVTDWEQATPLWYLQQVEGLRPDVEIRYPIDRWHEALGTGRPVYVARNVPGLDGHRLTAAGPLVRIEPPAAQGPPTAAVPLHLAWEGGLELTAYERHDAPGADLGPVVPVTLHFRLAEPTPSDHSFSLRLLSPTGETVWAEDRGALALGMYQTSRWPAGEVVGDYREIPVPASLPPGEYRVALVVYTARPDGTWRNLRLRGAEEERVTLFTLRTGGVVP